MKVNNQYNFKGMSERDVIDILDKDENAMFTEEGSNEKIKFRDLSITRMYYYVDWMRGVDRNPINLKEINKDYFDDMHRQGSAGFNDD